MDRYFPFSKLVEWYDIFSAIWISLAIFFVVYVLASLYYWSWKDMFTLRQVPPVKREPLWQSNTVTISTTTYTTFDLQKQLEAVEQEQKTENKTVRKTKRKRSNTKV